MTTLEDIKRLAAEEEEAILALEGLRSRPVPSGLEARKNQAAELHAADAKYQRLNRKLGMAKKAYMEADE